jgi:transcription termination factor Rho
MLESKDKDTLMEMAKALGVKVTARAKKSEIIDKILDTTGSGPAMANPSVAAAPAAGVADERVEVARDETAASSTITAEESVPAAPPAVGDSTSAVGGEPLADWEIELAEQGISTESATVDPSHVRDRADRTPNRNGSDRSDRNGGERTEQGDRPQNRNPNNDRNGSANNASSNSANSNNANDGDGNRRRRRRRKGRAGQEGPQGEDVELLEHGGSSESTEPVDVAGYLDIRDEGYGFVRVNGYLPSKEDAYIQLKLARQYGLRKGDHITGKVRPAGRNEKNPGLIEVYTVNGGDPELAKRRPHFESLTALFPDQRLTLEDPNDPTNMTARIIDLVSPIGKGQRGIIVSPPKAGKTTVMKTIAKSIELNNPEVELLVLLIDERPEEVTDMRRTVKGEVIASTFDRPSDEHTHVAEMTIAKARRLVEAGKDVVIILDGITRLSRAYNLAAPASGKILSGGIDAGALYPPKKFFGSARNVEEGGSLTILATALVDTNSRMDEAIFEEFKGTGNMELRLDRRVAERRIYPAIDVDASSTRHEELLFDRKQLQQVWKLRRVLSGLAQDGSAAAGLELLIDRLKTFRTNDEFLAEIAKQP